MVKMSRPMIYLSFIIQLLFGNFSNSRNGLLIENYKIALMRSMVG